ncbi:MAG: thiolase family protein [Myxococcales bacterium]|nr:thiolase family protein [Myxococcales bacterium]MCB9645982.1 thiolase family protein [Deltaproteobacteria bacterium]
MAFPLNTIVASAVRTPVGRAIKGTLKDTRPDDMAAVVLKEAVARVPGLAPADVEDVVMGCAFPEAEQGFNVARNAVFLAGFPDTVTGETINRYCSSGLQAIAHAAMQIQCGLSEVMVAGGVESMSMVPMAGNKVSLNPSLVDSRPEAYIAMGLTAERVAAQFGISREMQDEFALNSHMKAVRAIEKKVFADEIVAMPARVYKDGEVTTVPFTVDECPRPETTLEALAKLRPAFSATGTVTAGNASPMNDGAAAAVLLSDAKAKALGVKPLGRFRGFTVQGVPPEIMGIGPVPAIRALLKQTGLKIEDIDLFEVNEAFASQAAYSQRELGIPAEKINVNGGAIALGHPLGCTGAKLSATLLYELRRRGGRFGIVSMCIGGGMGAAGLYEVTDE